MKTIPCTADTPSPDSSTGSALILVATPRYDLGAPCPKFSGMQKILAYQSKNRIFHMITLIYKLRTLNMLSPTNRSLTKMNLAY